MISIKKLATVGAAAGLLFGSAMPAFAWGNHHWSDDDLVINQGNNAVVNNGVLANSNTGNQTLGGVGDDNKAIFTGNATTVVQVATIANSNIAGVTDCDCFDDVTINQGNNAVVTNRVLANSNTGNQTLGGVGDDNKAIFTGNAYTGVAVSNLLNENIAIVGP